MPLPIYTASIARAKSERVVERLEIARNPKADPSHCSLKHEQVRDDIGGSAADFVYASNAGGSEKLRETSGGLGGFDSGGACGASVLGAAAGACGAGGGAGLVNSASLISG